MRNDFLRATMPSIDGSSNLPFLVSSGIDVNRSDWWDACETDSTATFFATPDWSDILTSSFKHFRARPLLFRFGDGANCVVPAVEVARLRGRAVALHSMPFGTYGGVVGDTVPGSGQADAALCYVLEGTKHRLQTSVYPNPLAEPIPATLSTGESYVHAPDLSKGWDGWWEGLEGKTRYHIKKAERRGVSVVCRITAASLERFYEEYTRAANRWAVPGAFGGRFFRSVWKFHSERTQVWLAYKGRKAVAGLLTFRFQSQIGVFLSFVRADARTLAPTHLLYAHLVRYAITEGCTDLSFLGSAGNAGVESFKRSLGGEEHPYRFAHVRGPVFRVAGEPLRWMRRQGQRLWHSAALAPRLASPLDLDP